MCGKVQMIGELDFENNGAWNDRMMSWLELGLWRWGSVDLVGAGGVALAEDVDSYCSGPGWEFEAVEGVPLLVVAG